MDPQKKLPVADHGIEMILLPQPICQRKAYLFGTGASCLGDTKLLSPMFCRSPELRRPKTTLGSTLPTQAPYMFGDMFSSRSLARSLPCYEAPSVDRNLDRLQDTTPPERGNKPATTFLVVHEPLCTVTSTFEPTRNHSVGWLGLVVE